MATPIHVTAPEKELRFTRSGQAVWFWLLAVLMVAMAVVLLISSMGRLTEPSRLHPAWALGPLACAWGCARLAVRLTRHAYLILTPLGMEIFPFFRPAAGMRVVAWGEVHSVENDPHVHRLTLHFNPERTSGIHLSLRPIRENLRALLIEALIRRVEQSAARQA